MGAVVHTLAEEIDCGGCFALMDQFAELTLGGEPAADLMPLVHAHLARCPDCREEFGVLLALLQLTT